MANEIDSVAAIEARDDWAVLSLLMGSNGQLWSVDDIIREHGDRIAALDAIARLHGAGLLHRTSDDFVLTTRAAARYREIAA